MWLRVRRVDFDDLWIVRYLSVFVGLRYRRPREISMEQWTTGSCRWRIPNFKLLPIHICGKAATISSMGTTKYSVPKVGKKKHAARRKPPIAYLCLVRFRAFLGTGSISGVGIGWDCAMLAAFGAAGSGEVGDGVAAVGAFGWVGVDEGGVGGNELESRSRDGGEGSCAEFVESADGDEDGACVGDV